MDGGLASRDISGPSLIIVRQTISFAFLLLHNLWPDQEEVRKKESIFSFICLRVWIEEPDPPNPDGALDPPALTKNQLSHHHQLNLYQLLTQKINLATSLI